jgi:hypothetical protein
VVFRRDLEVDESAYSRRIFRTNLAASTCSSKSRRTQNRPPLSVARQRAAMDAAVDSWPCDAVGTRVNALMRGSLGPLRPLPAFGGATLG